MRHMNLSFLRSLILAASLVCSLRGADEPPKSSVKDLLRARMAEDAKKAETNKPADPATATSPATATTSPAPAAIPAPENPAAVTAGTTPTAEAKAAAKQD